MTDARRLYADAVALIEEHGWKRTEPGEGWWWRGEAETTLGLALEETFHEIELDTRCEPGALTCLDNLRAAP